MPSSETRVVMKQGSCWRLPSTLLSSPLNNLELTVLTFRSLPKMTVLFLALFPNRVIFRVHGGTVALRVELCTYCVFCPCR